MRAITYLNPFSDQFHAYTDFKEKLLPDQKIKAIVVAVFLGLSTFFIAGLGGIAAFRLMVEHYTFKKIEGPKKPDDPNSFIPPTLIFASESPQKRIRPLLTKQRSLSFSAPEETELFGLSLEALKNKVLLMEINLFESFWNLVSRFANNAKNAWDTNKAIERLDAILESMSDDQFILVVELNLFWKMVDNNRYYPKAVEKLQPKHFKKITEQARKMLIMGDPLYYDDYAANETTLKKLISLIPTWHKENITGYLAHICPHATPNLETELVALIRQSPIELRNPMKKSLNEAIKTFPKGDRRSVPSPIKLKAQAKSCNRRTAPAPVRRPPIPDSFKEPDRHVVKLADEVCSKYLMECEELEKVPPEHQEDLFFWILQSKDASLPDKRKAFVQDYFSRFTNPIEDFSLLENYSDTHLSTLVKLLDQRRPFEILINQELRAFGNYQAPAGWKKLNHRLSIELKAFSKTQILWMLETEGFWPLISDHNYQTTFAGSLSSEQFEWFGEWFVTCKIERLKKEAERTEKENADLQKKEVDKQANFCSLFKSLPKDTPEQLKTLQKHALAILPHALKIASLQKKAVAHTHVSSAEDVTKAIFYSPLPILPALEFLLGKTWVSNATKALQDKENKLKEEQKAQETLVEETFKAALENINALYLGLKPVIVRKSRF